MTSNRLPVIIILLAVVLVIAYSSVFVVNAREQAIVVRFGQIQSVKTEPGIYFKLPLAFMDADRVQIVEKQALRFDLDNIRVQVRGGSTFDVDAFVIYDIKDVRKLPRDGIGRPRGRRSATSHTARFVAPPCLRSARL